MARISVYFITKAEDREEACANVESWLEDFIGREFYDGFTVVKEDVRRCGEFNRDFMDALKQRKQQKLQEVYRYEKLVEQWKAEGNVYQAGYCYVCLGRILMEALCEDMPFYNLSTQDWTEPDQYDWAVMVTLHC